MASSKVPLVERFWNRVERDPNSGCWLWSAAADPNGYGRVKLGPRTAAVMLVHRFSWVLANGPVPDGLHVLHRCDTPPCVNPYHLFLGTHLDNMRDMNTKGRGRQGPPLGGRNPNARLTEASVLEIRDKHRLLHLSYPALAEIFGVNKETIARVIRRDLWTHI